MNDYQPKVPLKKLPKGISKMLTNFGAELRKEVHRKTSPTKKPTKKCPFCKGRLKRIPVYSPYSKELKIGTRLVCDRCGAVGKMKELRP